MNYIITNFWLTILVIFMQNCSGEISKSEKDWINRLLNTDRDEKSIDPTIENYISYLSSPNVIQIHK